MLITKIIIPTDYQKWSAYIVTQGDKHISQLCGNV